MSKVYSTYEAKAKFGEIIRKVRAGKRVVISYRGEEVAEVRPLPKRKSSTLMARLKELEEQGVVGPPKKIKKSSFRPVVRRPGALARFLESRD